MTKKIDWANMYKAPGKYNPDGTERLTMKAKFAKSYAQQDQIEAQQERVNNMMPLLKKSLLDHLVNRKPIKVVRAFNIVVDAIAKGNGGSKFHQTREVIPAGEELIFDHLDNMMGQMIFKSAKTGKEYEIYTAETIAMGEGAYQTGEKNPGYYGLLLQTSIYENLNKLLESKE